MTRLRLTGLVAGEPYVALLTIHALDGTRYVALADVSNGPR